MLSLLAGGSVGGLLAPRPPRLGSLQHHLLDFSLVFLARMVFRSYCQGLEKSLLFKKERSYLYNSCILPGPYHCQWRDLICLSQDCPAVLSFCAVAAVALPLASAVFVGISGRSIDTTTTYTISFFNTGFFA